jgi:hypothetical protein
MSSIPNISQRLRSIAGRQMHDKNPDTRSESGLILRIVEELERRQGVENALSVARRYAAARPGQRLCRLDPGG